VRNRPNRLIEKSRIKEGKLASKHADQHGAFSIGKVNIIADIDGDWEHVSVSMPDQPPPWWLMAEIKDYFWKPEETVIQFHPPKAEYVNLHPFCLHMWRHTKDQLFLPEFYVREGEENAVAPKMT
jgi:hypothetical protein